MKGSYVFSVSYATGCYRHIQIAKEAPLSRLHTTITDAFGLPDGHMHVFFMNNCAWDNTKGYYCGGFPDSKNPATDEVRLCDFYLKKDSRFLYIYDFAHEKRFSVKLLRETEDAVASPRLIRSKGEFLAKSRRTEASSEKARSAFSGMRAKRERLIELYGAAAVNLYGALPLDVFCKIFNSHGNEPLEMEQAAKVLKNQAGREYI